jgi:hypothetical protein
VDQVIGYPRFGLAKEGTTVSVTKWTDDPEPVEVLAEIWLQIRGLLPPWCELNIIDQAVSVCGILKKIDWQSVFRDCVEVVRVQLCAEILLKSLLEGCSTFRANCFSFSSRWSSRQARRRLLVSTLLVLVMGVVIIILDQGMVWTLTRMVAIVNNPQPTIRMEMQVSWVHRGGRRQDRLVE